MILFVVNGDHDMLSLLIRGALQKSSTGLMVPWNAANRNNLDLWMVMVRKTYILANNIDAYKEM